MDIISWIILGALAGWIADALVGGNRYGAIGNIILGIIGAVVGGFLFGLMGLEAGGFWGRLVVAVIGAAVVLMIANAAGRRGGTRS